jgi:hypothetical protein
MIRLESFKALEASLSARLAKALRDATSGLYTRIQEKVDSGDLDGARGLAEGLSLTGFLAPHVPYLIYVTHLSMLFGASRVTRKPGTSVVGLGHEKDVAFQMVQTLQQTLTLNAEDYLRKAALQLIALQSSQVAKAEPAQNRILHDFASFMDASGKEFFNIAASLHTSRVSAYGFTAEADVLGLEEYQINEQLDSRTCPVCRAMHGKKFRVSDARATLNVTTRVTDPADLKQLAPWPKQSKDEVAKLSSMGTSELVAAGWHVPPFHPRCRGLLGRVGTVPTLAQLDSGSPQSSDRYTATQADFAALGVPQEGAWVKNWNTHVSLPPAELIARLRGQSADEFMSGLVLADSPAKVSGIQSLSATASGAGVKITAPLFGSSSPVSQSVILTADSFGLDYMTMAPGDNPDKLFKKYMQRVYNLASDLGVKHIALTANMEVGGYAWAKYGFRPSTLSQWESLKRDVVKGLKKSGSLSRLDPDLMQAFKAIMASADPASVFFLSDLSLPVAGGRAFGEAALSGTLWEGLLSLSDEEAVTRFLTYLGAS